MKKEQRNIFDQTIAAGTIEPDILISARDRIAILFTDGGVIQENSSPYGGSWAFVGTDDAGERLLEDAGLVIVPAGKLISNNTTEFMAATRALEAMPEGWCGKVFTDSENVVKRFKAMLKYGFRATLDGLPRNARERGFAALNHVAEVEWIHCDGHPTKAELAIGLSKKGRVVSIHNVRCDQLCTALQNQWKATDEGMERLRRGQYGLCHLCGFNLKEFNAPGANPYICLNCLRERDAAR